MAVYAPVRHFEFLNYDDPVYVTENPLVRGGLTWRAVRDAFRRPYEANWIPLTWVSLAVDAQIHGLNAGGFHLTNAFLHALDAVLLFVVSNAMTGAPWRSWFVAAVFALHPLHVESVAWITERKDVLSTLFWLLTLWSYAGYARAPTCARWLRTLAVFAAGLLAKPMLVTLPFVLLLLDVWPLAHVRGLVRSPCRCHEAAQRSAAPSIGRLIMEKVPFAVLAAAASLLTFSAQRQFGAVIPLDVIPFTQRVANGTSSYVWYLLHMLWPVGLAVFYPYQAAWPAPLLAAATLALTGVSLAVVWMRRQRPYLLVGWFWYLGTLIPVIGLVHVGEQSRADRFTYVPMIGILLAVAWGVPDQLGRWRWRTPALAVAMGVLAVACAVATSFQLQHWCTSVTLFQHALAVTAGNYKAHHLLGSALAEQRDDAAALVHLQEALRMKPRYAAAHCTLGNLLLRQQRVDDAIGHFNVALAVKPTFAEAHNGLGFALDGRGDRTAAVAHYRSALDLKPDFVEAHYNLAAALVNDGQIAEATNHYREVVRLRPEEPVPRLRFGLALATQGQIEQAIAEFRAAIRLRPDFAEAYYSLAVELAGLGRVGEAVAAGETALRLQPGFPEALRLLDALRNGQSGREAQPEPGSVRTAE